MQSIVAAELSDRTMVVGKAWSTLRDRAMALDYEESKEFVSIQL